MKAQVQMNLEQEVLRLYRRAVAERRWEIVEPLMCALEQLAKCDPGKEAAVSRAYLCIDREGRGRGNEV